MIRFSHTIIITTVLFMLCVGYGLWSSSHFEDFSEEIIEEYSVGILPDELLDNTIKKIRETGDDNEYIFKVTCESGLQYNFACATQCVRIDKVYRGGQELVGSTINVLVANRIFLDMRSINMSFVGEMKPGKEYLVLLNDCIKTPYMHIYNKRDEYLFSPFFPYSEVNATVHESISQNANWALYSEAKSEDFTLMSDAAVEKIKKLSRELTDKYR